MSARILGMARSVSRVRSSGESGIVTVRPPPVLRWLMSVSRASAADSPARGRDEPDGAATMPVYPAAMTKSTATAAKNASKDAVSPSYEQALEELERLVASMESGQLPLEQLLDGYRRGAELLSFCRSRLQAVEQQVKVLEGGDLKTWEGS